MQGKKPHSLSTWSQLVLLGMLGVFALAVLLFSVFNYQLMRRAEMQNEQDLLNLTVENVDTRLDGVETLLYQIFQYVQDIQVLETEPDSTKRFMARQNIARSLGDIRAWSTLAEFLFYFYPDDAQETLVLSGQSGGDAARYDEVQEAITNYLSERARSRGGFLAHTDGAWYIRYFRVRSGYVGACIPTEEILGKLLEMSVQSGSGVFLADADGAVYAGSAGFPTQVSYTQDGAVLSLANGRYVQQSSESRTGDFRIGAWTNLRFVREQIRAAIGAVVCFALAVLLLWLVLSFTMFRSMTAPILAMAQSMQRLGGGEWTVQASEDGRFQEFNQLGHQFNEMVGEIRTLKIDNYQRQLDTERVTLQLLQLQINPHFYLNALNIIYSLAELRDYERIQAMTLALVEYSRYTFRDASKLVTVAEEIEHVENYLHIQQMRFPDRVAYTYAISPEVEEALIPPFLLQGFVENSMKYAVRTDRCTVIRMSGRIIETKAGDLAVQLEVRDNGDGYSPEVLEQLQNDMPAPERDPDSVRGHHIGIRNARDRLSLIFGEAATLQFHNESGACTVMTIPLCWRDE